MASIIVPIENNGAAVVSDALDHGSYLRLLTPSVNLFQEIPRQIEEVRVVMSDFVVGPSNWFQHMAHLERQRLLIIRYVWKQTFWNLKDLKLYGIFILCLLMLIELFCHLFLQCSFYQQMVQGTIRIPMCKIN